MAHSTPFIDPARPRSRIKPFKAWKHMKKLLADKDDTKQAFQVIAALNGNSTLRSFQRFMASKNGPALLARRADLPALLDDRAKLKDLPKDSVGHAYVTFMEREGLSVSGLIAESQNSRGSIEEFDDDLLWYTNRQRDTHDLYHVLSGYGRDLLGENALLAYTHSQNGGMGANFIVFLSSKKMAKLAPSEAQINDVIAEARRNGKVARRIIEEDIEALLVEPLKAARERLNIEEPVLYKRALQIFAEYDVDTELAATGVASGTGLELSDPGV